MSACTQGARLLRRVLAADAAAANVTAGDNGTFVAAPRPLNSTQAAAGAGAQRSPVYNTSLVIDERTPGYPGNVVTGPSIPVVNSGSNSSSNGSGPTAAVPAPLPPAAVCGNGTDGNSSSSSNATSPAGSPSNTGGSSFLDTPVFGLTPLVFSNASFNSSASRNASSNSTPAIRDPDPYDYPPVGPYPTVYFTAVFMDFTDVADFTTDVQVRRRWNTQAAAAVC